MLLSEDIAALDMTASACICITFTTSIGFRARLRSQRVKRVLSFSMGLAMRLERHRQDHLLVFCVLLMRNYNEGMVS